MTRLAVVDTTGLVGTKMLETLDRRNIPFDELVLFSSARSAGQGVEFQGRTYTIQELADARTSEHFDYVLVSAGSGTSEHLTPLFERAGTVVIDNSSQWRMVEGTDLIVPEANEPAFTRGIIANPNRSTIQSVVPLKVLQDVHSLKRVVYTTYRAVPGSGVKGRKDLTEGVDGKVPEAYPYPIYNNVLLHIDVFLEDEYTKEEQRMIDEARKILNVPDLKVTATCARMPVQDSHSVEVDITLDKKMTAEDTKTLFGQDDHVVLVDDPENNKYPMAINSTNEDEVFVGRICRDDSLESTFHIWCILDNLLENTALNAI